LDLRAPAGTPVVAANAGKVLYAGRRIAGYGNMIVIRHAFGFSTVYAHNSKLFVQRGQRVKAGQKIALSGATGRVSGPHVHFELRHGTEAIDPFKVLAPPGQRPGRRLAKID
jgi:murein DD-endopeptidase MepM/ murein hydrolase activator NlpD